jgi:hypothetical protein
VKWFPSAFFAILSTVFWPAIAYADCPSETLMHLDMARDFYRQAVPGYGDLQSADDIIGQAQFQNLKSELEWLVEHEVFTCNERAQQSYFVFQMSVDLAQADKMAFDSEMAAKLNAQDASERATTIQSLQAAGDSQEKIDATLGPPPSARDTHLSPVYLKAVWFDGQQLYKLSYAAANPVGYAQLKQQAKALYARYRQAFKSWETVAP